jgi:hypothetical protein
MRAPRCPRVLGSLDLVAEQRIQLVNVRGLMPVVRFKDGKTVVTHIAELPADAPGRLH